MRLEFSKMHGLGNDFIVIDAINQSVVLDQATVRRLADRHFGVGCDQLLVVEKPTVKGVDFRYRIYNQDGGEVEQCGNGARCFARFVRDRGLTKESEIVVETNTGIITLIENADGQVTVDMGQPVLEPVNIPFKAPHCMDRYTLTVDDSELVVGVVSMGNPHVVLQVPAVKTAPVERLGPLLESHTDFPNRVNVGFMQIKSPSAIALRVFERGVGETLACGSGACAAVVVGRQWGLLNDKVTVQLAGGQLQVRWPGQGHSVMMTGPAEHVFEGYIEL